MAKTGSGNGFTAYSGNGAEAGSAACERPSWNPFQHSHQINDIVLVKQNIQGRVPPLGKMRILVRG